MSIDESGQFVKDGYIVENGNSFIEHYNGRDIPDEHKIFAFPEPEKSIQKALAAYRQVTTETLSATHAPERSQPFKAEK